MERRHRGLKLIISFMTTLMLISSHLFAQMKIQVVSATKQSQLPYASVVNKTQKLMYAADPEGTAYVYGNSGDTLLISYIGYQTLEILYVENAFDKVSLSPDLKIATAAQPVFCSQQTEVTVQSNDTKAFRERHAGKVWDRGTTHSRVAVRLRGAKAGGHLKSISFWTIKEPLATARSVHGPIRIVFYEVDDSTALPGKLLSRYQVIHHPKRTGIQTLHVDSLNIIVPEKGIYIAFQAILSEPHAWEGSNYRVRNKMLIDSVGARFGSKLMYARGPEFEINYFDAVRDEWVCSRFSKGSVRLEAVLAYCADMVSKNK